MAVGGLSTCPKCNQRVRDADWLNGACRDCGLKFCQMDPDALANEIERQQAEAREMGCRPAIRGLIVGGCTMLGLFTLLYMMLPDEDRTTTWRDLKMMVREFSAGIGAIGAGTGLISWGLGHAALRLKWDSVTTWAVSVCAAIAVAIMIVLLIRFTHQ